LKDMNALKQLIQDNPHLPVKFMYQNDGSDFDYTLGSVDKATIEDIFVDDERVWILSSDEDELVSYIEDCLYYSLFPSKMHSNTSLSDDELQEVDLEAQKQFESIKWEKVILVYIKG